MVHHLARIIRYKWCTQGIDLNRFTSASAAPSFTRKHPAATDKSRVVHMVEAVEGVEENLSTGKGAIAN